MKDPIVYVVHCVDTEGPLNETIEASFERLEKIFKIKLEASEENLKKLQAKAFNLGGLEDAVANCFSKSNLAYNSNYYLLDQMHKEVFSKQFRSKYTDDFDGNWVFSWHVMDHVGYFDNPRAKDIGHGNVFRYYNNLVSKNKDFEDEINWHFHPLSVLKKPLAAATSFSNNLPLINEIIARRIIDFNWFPVVNRPGFHSERQDANQFLENWIPFDFANQAYEFKEDQPDLRDGRFGDWRRAPKTWNGYNPAVNDYQVAGASKRIIFRCLNVGTRTRLLKEMHVEQAFTEANEKGSSVLSFADHDYRDIRPDVHYVWSLIQFTKNKYPNVKVRFVGSHEAAISHLDYKNKEKIELNVGLSGNLLVVKMVKGLCFGPQPFLAIKTKDGNYYHDNFDEKLINTEWSYTFDDQTIPLDFVETIGVGSAGKYGRYSVKTISVFS